MIQVKKIQILNRKDRESAFKVSEKAQKWHKTVLNLDVEWGCLYSRTATPTYTRLSLSHSTHQNLA